MRSITLEVRDRMTFIPVIATSTRTGHDQATRYLLDHAGFKGDGYVFVTRLSDMRTEYEPNDWGGRTMPAAHRYIASNFDDLAAGSVVDVEVVLGEKQKPAVPQRLDFNP